MPMYALVDDEARVRLAAGIDPSRPSLEFIDTGGRLVLAVTMGPETLRGVLAALLENAIANTEDAAGEAERVRY